MVEARPMSKRRPFQRTRFTWLAYGMLGYYAYLQSVLGPIMPFLRDELRLSFSVGGLHATAYAIGMVLVGLAGERVMQALGTRRTFWFGGMGMAAGALLFLSAQSVLVTLGAVFVMGWLGTLLLATIQATLAHTYREQRAIALLESNIMAACFAALPPLIVGFSAAIGLGWRTALFVAAGGWFIAALLFRDTAIPSSPPAQKSHDSKDEHLPVLFWLYWVATFLGTAMEWVLILWSAEFLVNTTGLGPAFASISVVLFSGMAIVGRLIGSRLVRRYVAGRLLLLALSIVSLGFPLFWLGAHVPLKLIGLGIAGLGIANLFPLGLSAGANSAPTLPNQASARISLASGLAILLIPQILGIAADQFGIQRAFVLVILLLLPAIGITLWANRTDNSGVLEDGV